MNWAADRRVVGEPVHLRITGEVGVFWREMARVVTRLGDVFSTFLSGNRHRWHVRVDFSKGLVEFFEVGIAKFSCKMADCSEKNWQSVVTFDFETTGLLGPKCEIIQIAAAFLANPEDGIVHTYNAYILPKGPISKGASRVNNLRKARGGLYCGQNRVDTVPRDEAINNFVRFLGLWPAPVLLVAHNGMKFDGPLLAKAVQLSGCYADFTRIVFGMADTLPLYRHLYPGLEKHTQEFLVKYFLPGYDFNAHNALDDCRVLLDLALRPELTDEELKKYTVDVKKMMYDVW